MVKNFIILLAVWVVLAPVMIYVGVKIWPCAQYSAERVILKPDMVKKIAGFQQEPPKLPDLRDESDIDGMVGSILELGQPKNRKIDWGDAE